jgi:hypothetical protein
MRKFLFFALALVAGVLAFTSCENNGGNALVGTWSRDTEKDASGWYETQILTFSSNNGFFFEGIQHNPERPDVNSAMLFEGTYEIKGDIATVHYLKHGWRYDGQAEWVQGFEPHDEKIKFNIDGNKLTIIRYYGEEHQNEPEVFTKQ